MLVLENVQIIWNKCELNVKIMCGGSEAAAAHYLHVYFTFVSYYFHIFEHQHIMCTFLLVLISYLFHILIIGSLGADSRTKMLQP